MPDKPSGRGLFGLPEGTGAAPITGAPAAHCFKLLRHGLENLAGSDQKHHEYVLVLDWTVAGDFAERDAGLFTDACKLLIGRGEDLLLTFVTGFPLPGEISLPGIATLQYLSRSES